MANHLCDALLRHASCRPEAIFATDADGRVQTLGELADGAARMAGVLRGFGVSPGERVAVQVDKSLSALELYLGTVMAGGLFLPLNTAYTETELSYFLNDATPRVFVCDPAKSETLRAAARQAGTQTLLTLDRRGQGTLTDAQGQAAPMASPVPRGPDDMAAILYTSGTTGRSKGAMLSHHALLSNSRTLAGLWRFTESDVLIHALPIFHTHGLFVASNVALLSGASLIFLPGFDADTILEAMPNATTMMGVPTFYTRLLADPRLTPDRAANMRLFISGSAPLLAETHRDWERRTGHRILERYGMTETNMNTSNPYDGERRPGTVGFALPDVELRIMGEDGAEVPTGETGMIEVRGPNVFSGYWRMPEKTAEELRPDGWFITGDLGRVDADGYITIVGRAKDLIISGGFNIYPKEVESLIDDLPGVLESAVIGVPHPDFGEAVVAIVVADGSADLTGSGLLAGIAGDLARFKHPKKMIFVDTLPRNTMGKVQKAALRETHAGLFDG
ncbi:malonate--CoA ligase [Rhodophyticola sp.]|jgi:malonyl-CoA/methylmalonyl-CoA synthetase|uniref:malonate--CoA ligase n=1 Tax=Rhodophyticola sp. TaxID=2680032 RepID=UPI003D28B8F5